MAAINQEDELRRRVQHKLAAQFLTVTDIDPPQNEKDEDNSKTRLSDEMDPDIQKKFEEKFNKYKTKTTPYNVQNITWLIVAFSVIYYTDFFNVILYHRHVNRIWFNIGAVCIIINTLIAVFLIVWLCYVRKIPHTLWEREYPAAIPTATACFLVGSLCVTIGLWPVWSFFTPFILFIVFMGVVVIICMLPNF